MDKQLYSVLGPERIVSIVSRFYDLVFQDEAWFTSVFKRVGSKERHVLTQSSMWIDVMGGGMQYHGGEFRLNFHHNHNASVIGELNPRVIRRINFMNMTSEQVEALSEVDIKAELQARGVDVSELTNKQALINKALSL